MRTSSLLADSRIRPLPQNFPNLLNLFDFQIFEICKAYSPRYFYLSNNGLHKTNVEFSPPYINKVAVLSLNAVHAPTDNYAIMPIIYSRKKLGFLKARDEGWTKIEEQHSDYSDVISYKGQFYAVNYCGRAMVVDSFLKVTEIASSICDGGGHRKHLVELLGDLLLVDRYLHVRKQMVVHFKVHRPNEAEHNWVEVRNLGDQVLFVGNECSFSTSARDFAG